MFKNYIAVEDSRQYYKDIFKEKAANFDILKQDARRYENSKANKYKVTDRDLILTNLEVVLHLLKVSNMVMLAFILMQFVIYHLGKFVTEMLWFL